MLCLSVLLKLPINAQTIADTISKSIKLAEIEVSTGRAPVLFSKTGRSIEVVGRTTIEKMPVLSVEKVLDMMQQIDIRQRGPLGIQSDVGIRGGSFDQVLILLNGVNITDPQTGHFNLNLPVSLNCIERIEVLEGPAARVYGPNAFSGAINFITTSNVRNSSTLNATAGSHGLLAASASRRQGYKNTEHFISASHSQTDGYMADTDFRNTNLFYQGRLKLDNANIELQTGFNTKDYGALTFYSAKYPNQYEENRTTFASVKLNSGSRTIHSSQAYWRRNSDLFDLMRYSPDNKNNHHLTDVLGVKQNILIPWRMGKTSVGGEIRSETVWSTTLGNEMVQPKKVAGHDAQYTKWFSRSNTALFVEHTWQHNNLSLTWGVLVNGNSALDWKFDLFPGADVSWWIHPKVKLTASANKALRLPTFTDLFYLDPVQKGNADLRPEEAVTYEGGVSAFQNYGSLRVSVYRQNAERLIDWGKTEGETMYQSRNLSRMKSVGVQFSGSIIPKELFGSRFFIQKIDAGFFINHQDKKAETGYESRFVMDYLKQKLVINIENRLPLQIMINWNIKYQDREGNYHHFATSETRGYRPFWLTDVRMSRQFGNLALYAEASNLFDNKYEDIANVPQPGLWIRGGININIKK